MRLKTVQILKIVAVCCLLLGALLGPLGGAARASVLIKQWFPYGYYATHAACTEAGTALIDPPSVTDFQCRYESGGPHPGYYHLYIYETY